MILPSIGSIFASLHKSLPGSPDFLVGIISCTPGLGSYILSRPALGFDFI